ncbi:MAG: PQQ-dependent dehydrogenase, methanol/ethanol family [Pseudomonadota bacterium]
MKKTFGVCLTILLAAISFLCLAEYSDADRSYEPVTQARLNNPRDGEWLLYRRTYDSWGYSPLNQIDRDNVGSLMAVWSLATGLNEAHQSPPLVNGRYMFITTPQNHVLAIDAKTGDILWRYRRELPDDLLQLHPTNRGVALYGDKVYLATVDAYLVALDATSGEVIWEVEVEDYTSGYYMTLMPLAAEGKIMVGMSGGEMGIRGFIQAFAADDGQSVWKTFLVPGPGEPGHETWTSDSWQRGGISIWVTGSYDPVSGLSYWGTGNPGPWVADQREGDNLYANSVVALNVETGAIESHHQYHWNDAWDWDEVSSPLLIDIERNGRQIKSLIHAGRNGYLWTLARYGTDIGFVSAEPYVRQNVFSAIDPKTGRPSYHADRVPGTGKRADFCPSIWGGKDWPPEAYSPRTGLLYIPANENLCSGLKGEKATYRPGELFLGMPFSAVEVYPHEQARDHIGELQAWDLNQQKKVWGVNFKSHNWGPILATAGDLIFFGGTNDRVFRALDATSGKLLWQQKTSSGVVGVPTTYEIDGKQYIAVLAGWGVDAERKQNFLDKAFGTKTHVPQGGVLWVFGLED